MQKPKADFQQLLQQNVVNSHSDPCPNPTNFMYNQDLGPSERCRDHDGSPKMKRESQK